MLSRPVVAAADSGIRPVDAREEQFPAVHQREPRAERVVLHVHQAQVGADWEEMEEGV